MNNKLVKTDGLWYKIKKFFHNLYSREQSVLNNEEKEEVDFGEKEQEAFQDRISYQKEYNEIQKKEALAQRLLKDEIDSYDLTEEETEDMIEYFEADIEKQKKELQRIREHIISMKKKLEN